MSWEIREGDCLALLGGMEDGSVDAVVTDPPYGLEFMGKEWDRLAGTPGYNERGRITERPDAQVPYGRGGGVNSYQAGRPMQDWHHAWATEALRVLKPGGHLLAFGGTRTYHRLACAIEDAGFEIRDCLAWMYGSGFPKSLDVSKAIDKAAGVEREVVGERPTYPDGTRGGQPKPPHDRVATGLDNGGFVNPGGLTPVTAPATPEAAQWQGWGTALKPAHEPIVLARKALEGTVAANVQQHGTGALNVDGCRVEGAWTTWKRKDGSINPSAGFADDYVAGSERPEDVRNPEHPAGRWPANVVLDEEAGAMLDEQTGELSSGLIQAGSPRAGMGYHGANGDTVAEPSYGDTGGASRFFYCPKADSAERHFAGRNQHPTVKPVALMQWLCRLVTPPEGLILDPFTGSGTTGMAALREGFRFLGMEREAEYVELARNRIRDDAPLFNAQSEAVAS